MRRNMREYTKCAKMRSITQKRRNTYAKRKRKYANMRKICAEIRGHARKYTEIRKELANDAQEIRKIYKKYAEKHRNMQTPQEMHKT